MATADPSALFDLGDELARVSGEVLRFRLRNRSTLSPEAKSRLENAEIELDQATARVRALGIAALTALSAAARADVQEATRDAESLLRRIRKAERALDIAGGVLGLAAAAIAGSPSGILSALKAMRDKLDGDKG